MPERLLNCRPGGQGGLVRSLKKLLDEVEAGLLRPNSCIYIYIYRDLHITLLVISLKFAASAVDPCRSLVKYSDERDKETGQSKLHRQILTKFWMMSVCLSLSHTRARALDHFPSNKTYNHLSAVVIGCTVYFNTKRLCVLCTYMEFECFLVQTVIFLPCTVLT